ncbi:MAG: hypothetical protein LWW85_07750 [Marinilabiliales bacterium]|nr:hypothetical protein [Marinilabiliales bacterium]
MIKRIGKILVWLVVTAFVALSLGFTTRERNKFICMDVRVEIRDSARNQFLRSSEIRKWVLNRYPQLMKRNLDAVNLRSIEEGLRNLKAVETVEVFPSIVGRSKPGEGSVVVRITQRDPVFRVDLPGRDYFMDRFGKTIDWTPGYSPRVLIASGIISYEFARKHLLPVIHYIQQDDFLSAQIDQIHVNGNGSLTMVPRIGEQIINFGTPENYQIKFRNLKALYKDGFKNGGWTIYKSINLMYINQVVCIKK